MISEKQVREIYERLFKNLQSLPTPQQLSKLESDSKNLKLEELNKLKRNMNKISRKSAYLFGALSILAYILEDKEKIERFSNIFNSLFGEENETST